MYSTRYSQQILMKPEFSRQILEKVSSIKCHQNRPLEAELFRADLQADGRTDVTKKNRHFSLFLLKHLKRQRKLVELLAVTVND